MLRLDILTPIKPTDPLGRDPGPTHSLPLHFLLPSSLVSSMTLPSLPCSAGPLGPSRRDTAAIKINPVWDAASLCYSSSTHPLVSIYCSPRDPRMTCWPLRPWERKDSHITINFVPLIKHVNMSKNRTTWHLRIEELYWIFWEIIRHYIAIFLLFRHHYFHNCMSLHLGHQSHMKSYQVSQLIGS